MPLIEMKQLTKDYGDGRGTFDLNLTIERGEVFGFVGTNGAGKTTTIRQLMGFLKPDRGGATINGLDCWTRSADIKRLVGYVPGEIAFPDASTGDDFLKQQAELLGLRDMTYAKRIIDKLQLDTSANLKRMSKGMKQKTAIVAALMSDPDILILDEPTTGLDPLMRAQFIELLAEQKQRGKTIFMSSHMFEEVESICDKVALIKEGSLIDVTTTDDIRHHENKVYTLSFRSRDAYTRFLNEPLQHGERSDERYEVNVHVNDRDINMFMRTLANYPIKSISEVKYTLEHYFNSLY